MTSITISSFFNRLTCFHNKQAKRSKSIHQVLSRCDHNDFEFDQVFSLRKARELLQQHLKDERNEEMILFVLKVKEYRKLFRKKDNNKQHELARQIIENFLQSTSKFEINVPQEEKGIVLNFFSSVRSTDPLPAHLFDKVQTHILHSLKEDVFPRFVKTKKWKTFVLTLDETTFSKIIKQNNVNDFKNNSSSNHKESNSNETLFNCQSLIKSLSFMNPSLDSLGSQRLGLHQRCESFQLQSSNYSPSDYERVSLTALLSPR